MPSLSVSFHSSMASLMLSSGRSPLPRCPQRLVAVFQPHRFSRTQEFQDEFAKALSSVDMVVLAPVLLLHLPEGAGP